MEGLARQESQLRQTVTGFTVTSEDHAMNRFWMALAAAGLMGTPAFAASPDPKDLAIPAVEMSRARELVRQLASEAYKEREHAQDELAKMGRLARPALSEALATDPSPEIRARTSRLLPRAETADLQARIDTFLADTEAKFVHDLPGWKLLRKNLDTKEVGFEKSARELYVEAIKVPANLEILAALELNPENAGRAIADRRITLFLQQNPGVYGRVQPGVSMTPRQPTLADVGVLLFAEMTIDGKHIPRSNQFGVTGAQFVQIAPSMQAIANPDSTPQGKAYRQIFIKWIDSRIAPDELNSVAWIANNFKNLKESGALLRRILTTEGVQGYAKGQALIFLLQRGKEELPTIRAQLKNDTPLQNKFQIAPNVMGDAQVRDIALALLLHNDGQDLKKFGFEFQQGMNVAQVAQTYWGYGFKSEEDRTAAHKKFLEYEAKKKDEPKKEDGKKDPSPPSVPAKSGTVPSGVEK